MKQRCHCGSTYAGIGSDCGQHVRRSVKQTYQRAYLHPDYKAYKAWLAATDTPCSEPDCTNRATTPNHITPLYAGGSWTMDNLSPHCQYHSNAQGAQVINEGYQHG